jgi:hypothetical protein
MGRLQELARKYAEEKEKTPILPPADGEEDEELGVTAPPALPVILEFPPESVRHRFEIYEPKPEEIPQVEDKPTRPEALKSREMPKVELPPAPEVPQDIEDLLKDFLGKESARTVDNLVKVCEAYYELTNF